MRLFALAALAALSVAAADLPRPVPNFEVSMPGGKKINLREYKGKILVVEVLLTTCSHCQKASQGINKLLREFGKQGVEAIGVAVNDGAPNLVEDYVKQFNLDFPVGWAPRDPVIGLLQHPVMMMMSFPNVLIIDRTGQIRHQFPGGDKFFENEEKNLRDLLPPLLKAPKKST